MYSKHIKSSFQQWKKKNRIWFHTVKQARNPCDFFSKFIKKNNGIELISWYMCACAQSQQQPKSSDRGNIFNSVLHSASHLSDLLYSNEIIWRICGHFWFILGGLVWKNVLFQDESVSNVWMLLCETWGLDVSKCMHNVLFFWSSRWLRRLNSSAVLKTAGMEISTFN